MLEDADLGDGVDDEAEGDAEAGEEHAGGLGLLEPQVGEDDAAGGTGSSERRRGLWQVLISGRNRDDRTYGRIDHLHKMC